MITNDSELEATLGALRNVEDALAGLHREVWPKNPRMYEAMAEAPIDMLKKLRAEVDAYLGVNADSGALAERDAS